MKVLRTPDKYFTNIKGYPFDPIYTDIYADDGTEIRIHHIDEGPSAVSYTHLTLPTTPYV